jgi:hypothetical protein
VKVNEPLPGNFIPERVREIVWDLPELFPGFGFIKNGNRDHAFYADVVRLVRYFTRHYFKTLYFLKECCNITYVDLFLWMTATKAVSHFEERLSAFIDALDPKLRTTMIARAVFDFDQVIESLKQVNIEMEITNTYSKPERYKIPARYRIFELSYDVALLFDRMPGIELTEAASTPAAYLAYDNSSNQIITLRLVPWQRDLARALEATGCLEVDKLEARFVALLQAGKHKDILAGRVKGAVSEATRILAEIIRESATTKSTISVPEIADF